MTELEQKLCRIYILADCLIIEPASSLRPKAVNKDRVLRQRPSDQRLYFRCYGRTGAFKACRAALHNAKTELSALMLPSDGIQHLRHRGVMTNAQYYFALAVELAGVLVIVMILLMRFHRLDRRIDRLEDHIDRVQERVHNDYEALIVKILELDAHVSFGHVESR